MLTKILDSIHNRLPEKWRPGFNRALFYVFYIPLYLYHKFPYIKSRNFIAFYEKFMDSQEYEILKLQFEDEAIVESYIQNMWWKEYAKHLTLTDRLKCIFIPFTIIDKYNKKGE